MRVQLLYVLGLAIFMAAAVDAKERVWTDAAGRTMTAEFVRELDGEVTLLRAGKLVTVKLASLSERDQQAVRDLSAGKQVADDPAPAEPRNPFEPAAPSPAPSPAPTAAPTNPFEPAKPADPAGDPPPAGEEKPIPIGKKPVPIVNRVWTDANGQQTTARFVRIFGGNVVLSQAGKNITIPFYTLSQADQDHVKELLTSRGQEALIPPPPPAPRTTAPDGAPGPLAAPPPQFAPPPPPPAFPDPNVAFEEARRRQEEARQRAAEQFAQAQAAIEQQRQAQAQAQAQRDAENERRRQEAQQAYDESQRRMAEALAANPRASSPAPPSGSPSNQSAFDRALPHEVVGQCEGCKGNITKSQWDRGKCAHCGITWAYSIDEFGNKKYRGTSLDKVAEKVPALLFVVIAVVAVGIGVVGAFVSIIVAIVRSASAPQQQRRY